MIGILFQIFGNLWALFTAGVRRGLRLLAGRTPADYARLRLSGALPWTHVPHGFLSRGEGLALDDLDDVLRDLAAVNGLKGVVFVIDPLETSLDRAAAAADRIKRFAERGFHTVAVLVGRGNLEYLVGSVCAEVYLTPGPGLAIGGMAVEVTYFHGLLEKTGVGVDLVRRGKYKSAGEPFTRSEPSPEAAEELDALLDGAYEQLLYRVALHRQRPVEAVRAWFQRGAHTPDEALDGGLIDGIAHVDDIDVALAAKTGREVEVESASKVRAFTARPLELNPWTHAPRGVGVLRLSGIITQSSRRSALTPASQIVWDELRPMLRSLKEEKSIRALVVWIDSRGGEVLASELFHDALARIAEEIPTVAFMDRVAASGGYYLAAGTSKIFTGPTTITGSIGVIALKPAVRAALARCGVNAVRFERGGGATIHSPYDVLSDADRARVDAEVGASYKLFVERVGEAREKTFDEVDALAQGRVWLGSDAVKHGLADEAGTLDDAVRCVAREAQLPDPEHPVVLHLVARRPLWRRLQAFATGEAFAARAGLGELPLVSDLLAPFLHLTRATALALWPSDFRWR